MDHVFGYGDNIHHLKELASDSVDLCYFDPPFNSGREYNRTVEECFSQEKAYIDLFHWNEGSQAEWEALLSEVNDSTSSVEY